MKKRRKPGVSRNKRLKQQPVTPEVQEVNAFDQINLVRQVSTLE